MNTTTDRLLAEWEPHNAIMLSWPHSDTDWAYMLEEVQACYRGIMQALIKVGERVLVLDPSVNVATNDTWVRDYGPLSLASGTLLDFRFNAWGQKFASNFDNQANKNLAALGLLPASLKCHKDFVLEGGSIECDGRGTILTTACCLLSPNRNEPMDKAEIERQLLIRLHARKVLWLDAEPLPGDDTDGHIDTLARLAPGNVVVYTVEEHLRQIETWTNADGEALRGVRLPMPDTILDPDDNSVLPATYANYLVTNKAVLVPTYGQTANDAEACRILAEVFPGREIVGVDCRALIRQHGSLHCATMQVRTSAI